MKAALPSPPLHALRAAMRATRRIVQLGAFHWKRGGGVDLGPAVLLTKAARIEGEKIAGQKLGGAMRPWLDAFAGLFPGLAIVSAAIVAGAPIEPGISPLNAPDCNAFGADFVRYGAEVMRGLLRDPDGGGTPLNLWMATPHRTMPGVGFGSSRAFYLDPARRAALFERHRDAQRAWLDGIDLFHVAFELPMLSAHQRADVLRQIDGRMDVSR